MASKLPMLQSKAAEGSKFFSKRACAYYKQLMEQNKQFIQDPPTVEACKLLSKQLFFTRLASIPGRSQSFWKEVDYLKELAQRGRDLKTEDLGIAALFGLECYAWSWVGEIVGRGSIIGYHVQMSE